MTSDCPAARLCWTLICDTRTERCPTGDVPIAVENWLFADLSTATQVRNVL